MVRMRMIVREVEYKSDEDEFANGKVQAELHENREEETAGGRVILRALSRDEVKQFKEGQEVDVTVEPVT